MRRLLPFGRLDRYVLRLFTMSYVTALLLVVGLFVIVSLSLNIDEFLQEHADGSTAGVATLVRYYLLHVPFIYLEMSPFITLIAGLFAATRLVKNNEVVAALGAGIGARRLLAPMLFAAVVLAAAMFTLREVATDSIGRERDRLGAYLLEQESELAYPNLWVRDGYGQRLRVAEFFPEGPDGPEARGLLHRYTAGDATVAVDATRMHAPEFVEGRWRWRLEGGFRTYVDAKGRKRTPIDAFAEVDVGPDDFETAFRGRERPLDLTFAEATALHERDPTNLQYQTVRLYHVTFPLAGLVLLLVGLPFLLGQERGRGVERVAMGFLMCMVYFAVDFVTRTLGITGQLGPVYSAWFPIVLFGSLGAVLYGSMRS